MSEEQRLITARCSTPRTSENFEGKRVMRAIQIIIAGWFLGVALTGCSQKPPLLSEKTTGDSVWVKQDESFNPLNLKEEDPMKLPDSRLKASESASAGGKSSSRSGGGLREAAGFRVQLIATDSEVDARECEQKALLDFKNNVYLIFDPPNYKVRIGDFQDRAQANEFKERAIRMGYVNAWVVQSRVLVQDR